MCLFFCFVVRARGGREREKREEKTSLVEILLNTRLCHRGGRRNRGVGLRGVAGRSGARSEGPTWQNWRFPHALAFGAFSDRGKTVLAQSAKRVKTVPFRVRRKCEIPENGPFRCQSYPEREETLLFISGKK